MSVIMLGEEEKEGGTDQCGAGFTAADLPGWRSHVEVLSKG
jgi:hypothetical protein